MLWNTQHKPVLAAFQQLLNSEQPGKESADLYAAQLGISVCFATLSCIIEWKCKVFPVVYRHPLYPLDNGILH